MERIEVAEFCALMAAKRVREVSKTSTGLQTEIKDDDTLVTQCDKESGDVIRGILAAYCPNDLILSEEKPEDQEWIVSQSSFWTVDEVDGTVLLANGITQECAVIVGYIQNGQPAIGAVCFPGQHMRMILAERGKGCFLGGRRRRIRYKRPLSRALINIDMYKKSVTDETWRRIMKPLIDASEHIRVSAAAFSGLELLLGRTGLCLSKNYKNWDAAAIAIAVIEAGGLAVDAKGAPLNWNQIFMQEGVFYFANASIAEEAFAVLEKANH